MGKNILIAGYGQTVVYTELQGPIQSSFSREVMAAGHFAELLRSEGHTVTYLTAAAAAIEFPESLPVLDGYDVVLLGDISADTLLLHPEGVFTSTLRPNRLKLLREYVSWGGGFLMAGGWFSFQGIGGKGGYHRTAVEEILPVTLFPFDDRVETPEGSVPRVVRPDHHILQEVPQQWPPFLGYNRLTPKSDGQTLLAVENDPFLVVGEYGRGRVAAFSSSLAPHWGGVKEYLEWNGYRRFWSNLVEWLASGHRG